MKRLVAPIALLCLMSCAEEEEPTILVGSQGACGSVVSGVVPTQVTCPDACPIPVKAFRVRDPGTCERSENKYVACISPSGGNGRPGAAVLETPEGNIFVDSPSFDCSDGSQGCVAIDTATHDRWATCSSTEAEGCECACNGDTCPYDRFVEQIGGCGLPSPCAPITGGETPTDATLQCYMDVLADGGPIEITVDVSTRHHITNQLVTSRRILAVNDHDVIRLDAVAFDRPVAQCDLQDASFFLTCDPDDPTDVNLENEDGLVERLPCTDPETWIVNCRAADPVCPGG